MIVTDDLAQNQGQVILDLFSSLELKRETLETVWEEVEEYVLPHRKRVMDGSGYPDFERSTKIYDGTPLTALQLLVDGIQGYMVSPSLNWFKLRMSDRELRKSKEVSKWIEEVENHFYSIFAKSNFYESMSKVIFDGASMGTSTVGIEEDIVRGEIVFHAYHPYEIYIQEDKFGKVDTVFRRFFKTGRNLLKEFPDMPEAIKTNIKSDPYENFECIHAILPREDIKEIAGENKELPYASVYILKDSGEILKIGGYRELPSVTWRWRTNSGEIYGRCPVMDAMTDIKKLHQMGRTLLQQAHMATSPMWNVPAEMKGRFKLKPGAINYYESTDRLASPTGVNINYPVGVDREERVQKILEDHFRVDFFLMLSRAERQMTAQEVIERQGEKASVLGTTIGRISSELLDSIIDRVFQIELDAGRLPELPIELREKKSDIRVEYRGPLAQAQRKFLRTQGITQSLNVILPMVNIKPEILDNFDFDQMVRRLAEEFDIPEDAVLDMKEVTKLREARAQMQQEQAQQQMQMQQQDQMMKANKAPEAGSPLDRVMRGSI